GSSASGQRADTEGAGSATATAPATATRAESAAAATAEAAAAGKVDAADITRADTGVPRGMDLAGVVDRDAIVLPVVEQDVGVTLAGRRAVQVVDRQRAIGHTTPVVVVEPGVDVREIHGLGVDVLRAL